MTKLLKILKSTFAVAKNPNVVAVVVYAVVGLAGAWAGVDYLAIPDTSEVTPIEVLVSFEQELEAMQAQIDKLMKIYELETATITVR